MNTAPGISAWIPFPRPGALTAKSPAPSPSISPRAAAAVPNPSIVAPVGGATLRIGSFRWYKSANDWNVYAAINTRASSISTPPPAPLRAAC